MKRYILGGLAIVAGLVTVSLYVLFFHQAGIRLSVFAADVFLPGEFAVESVQGRFADKFVLEGIHYSKDRDNTVSIDKLSFFWRPFSLFQKELDIRSFEVKGINLAFVDTEDPTQEDELIIPSITLPLSIKLEKAIVDSLVVVKAADTPIIELTTIVVEDFSGEGRLLKIGKCSVTSESFQVVVQGQLQTDEIYSLRFNVDYSLNSEGQLPVAGKGTLDGTFKKLSYDVHLFDPVKGNIKGYVYDLIGNNVRWNADVMAEVIALSHLNKDWPEIVFSDFQASAEGTLSSYSLKAETNATYDSLQDIDVSTALSGDFNGLQILDAQLNYGETSLRGNGQLAWKDEVAWQAGVTGSHIDPGSFDQRWPGNLDLEVVTSGQQSNGRVITVVDLVGLDGELRGYPVNANGKIEIDGNDIAIDTFYLQSSDSFLRASGRLADLYDLDLKLESSKLETLWPGLTGSLEAQGNISGTRQNPEFQFDLSANKVAIGETKIASVLASGTGVLDRDGSINATVTATDLAISGTSLDSVQADINGTLEDHFFETSVNAPQFLSLLRFEGGYVNKEWRGHLSKGDVQTDRFDNWQLQHSTPISLSSNNVDIGKLCLVGGHSGVACVEGKYEHTGQWGTKAEITALPVDMFRNLQGRFEEIGGFLSGTANLKGQGSSVDGGEVKLTVDDLSIRNEFSEEQDHKIVWQKNTLHTILDGKNVDVKINSTLKDGSSLAAEAILTDMEIFPFSIEKAKSQGNVYFNIKDLQALRAISFPTIEPYGSVKGELKFSGKLEKPDLVGHAQLDQGKLNLPALGITIKEIKVSVDGKDNNLAMEVTAASGEGKIHVEGAYPIVKQELNEPVELHIKGENFEIVKLTEARINISPDLKVKISKDQGDLTGSILVTEANITPLNLSGTVSPSKDVVFVDDQQEKKQAALPLYTDITLLAGENFRVNAYGLRGKIVGQLEVKDSPSKPMIGEGNLEVEEGTFSVYGRQLKIARGRVLYNGSPLDNPGIDIRAENTVDSVTTGIEVSGFLREPDVSFYSTPAMAENEIIKRLLMNTSLVGSSEDKGFVESVTSDTALDSVTSTVQNIKEGLKVDDVKIETGEQSDEVSLVIGTWLTPKLYVSYGKNLLNESGSFNTRYVLGYGFSFETETGDTQNGVDLMYVIGN